MKNIYVYILFVINVRRLCALLSPSTDILNYNIHFETNFLCFKEIVLTDLCLHSVPSQIVSPIT